MPGTTRRRQQKLSDPNVLPDRVRRRTAARHGRGRGPGRARSAASSRPRASRQVLRWICAECCGACCAGHHSVLESAQVITGVRRGRAADIPVAAALPMPWLELRERDERHGQRGRCRGSGHARWCCASGGAVAPGRRRRGGRGQESSRAPEPDSAGRWGYPSLVTEASPCPVSAKLVGRVPLTCVD
jgi:hypothetical protein